MGNIIGIDGREEKLNKIRKETLEEHPHLEILKEDKNDGYKLSCGNLQHTDLNETSSKQGTHPINNVEEFAGNFNLDEFNRLFQENRHLLHVNPLTKHEGLPKKTYQQSKDH